ncbi:hypothetical protein ACQKMV_07520 [Lysinibacillus sp. NPDC094403]|uniref:hypothetical protein n=1 Tax=Lysinibacillus sp. NPDC094403 TaxID=3390581 RepID=UPI003D034B63
MCESAATAADVFCAKAKRQQQDVFCAKAQRQQQMFFARKRSANEASAADVGHSVVAALRLSSSISAGVWTPSEKQLKTAFISPPIEVRDFCNYRCTFATKDIC